jgi:hypothetical protein
MKTGPKFIPNKIIYQDNLITKFILKSKKYGDKIAIIDTKNINKINKYHWCAHKNYRNTTFYVVAHWYENGARYTLKLHRVILNLTDPKILVDHISHDGLDCREENLRECNSSQNSCNRTKYNLSGYKGVCKLKTKNKWQVTIKAKGKKIHLGYFIDIKDAALAYNLAAIKYHKEFANINYF